MKNQIVRFEHTIYTSIINSYGFQASSKGMKKKWEKKLEKYCEYTHSKSLNLNNPDHIEQLPVIYRFYSIQDEKDNDVFFVSRTSYGKQDQSHRLASITHIVNIEEKLFYTKNVVPFILYKLIPWIQFFEGKPSDELPLLEIDMNEYNEEIHNLKQFTQTEANMEEIELMSSILLNTQITDKRSFIIYQSDYTEQFFNQLSLCFFMLPAYAIKKISFTINDYYPPRLTFNLILFDPNFPVNSVENYNDLSFFFPSDKSSDSSVSVSREAIKYLISILKTSNFSELAEIKEKMNTFIDWELTPDHFQIIFAFSTYVLKLKERNDLPSNPKSFNAWIDIVKAFHQNKNQLDTHRYLFLDCCEKWLFNAPVAIIPDLKPEIILEIISQWFLLLRNKKFSDQFMNFLLILFSNLLVFKKWPDNELFKEKIINLIFTTFQSENQYIELLKVLGNMYRNEQDSVYEFIKILIINNPDPVIKDHCFKYLCDQAF